VDVSASRPVSRKNSPAVVVVLVLSGLGLLVFFWPRAQAVDVKKFDRIQEGMSLPEVSAIMGCEPGDYTSGPVEIVPGSLDSAEEWPRHWPHPIDSQETWRGDTGVLTVYFCKERAAAKWFRPCARIREDISERMERWTDKLTGRTIRD
jgi:hypothetical protein